MYVCRCIGSLDPHNNIINYLWWEPDWQVACHVMCTPQVGWRRHAVLMLHRSHDCTVSPYGFGGQDMRAPIPPLVIGKGGSHASPVVRGRMVGQQKLLATIRLCLSLAGYRTDSALRVQPRPGDNAAAAPAIPQCAYARDSRNSWQRYACACR